MSRKDYELIARAFKDAMDENHRSYIDPTMAEIALKTLAVKLADKLQTDNSAFNRSTFLARCGF